jgi:hypothetical protein
MNKKRPHQVTFRLSDEELEILKEKISSSGKKQQEYLRRAALEMQITNMAPLKELIPEMKKQGTNLNQVAKKLNENGYVDYGNVLAGTLKEVKETWQSLKQYLATHR